MIAWIPLIVVVGFVAGFAMANPLVSALRLIASQRAMWLI